MTSPNYKGHYPYWTPPRRKVHENCGNLCRFVHAPGLGPGGDVVGYRP